MTQVFNIALADGTTTLALPKAIQRDPLKDIIEHVDLIIVRRGEKVTVEVPVHLTGEAARDTLVRTQHDRLAITAEAMHLPEHIEVSIEGLPTGARVTAGEVNLPDGAQLVSDPELVVVFIDASPTAEEMEGEVAEAAEAEEPAAQEGAGPEAAAAPAEAS